MKLLSISPLIPKTPNICIKLIILNRLSLIFIDFFSLPPTTIDGSYPKSCLCYK